MRYFIAKNGSAVVEKQALCGDNDKMEALINQYKTAHPALTVTELDQDAFDATVYTPPLTSSQQAWSTFKASSPTVLQIATFFARYLGLE
jgi:hypothetical protein